MATKAPFSISLAASAALITFVPKRVSLFSQFLFVFGYVGARAARCANDQFRRQGYLSRCLIGRLDSLSLRGILPAFWRPSITPKITTSL